MHSKKSKGSKLPHPLAFYIKLYCKRKKSAKSKYQNNLIEATKSWLSLNELEKKQFQEKYKEYEQKYTLKCFNQLKNAEPFMKIRENDSQDKVISNAAEDTILETFNEDAPPSPTVSEPNLEVDSNDQPNDQCIENVPSQSELEEHQIEQSDAPMEVMEVAPIVSNVVETQAVILEPLPLTLKTGKELFELLNGGNETTNWPSLSQIEKNQYNRAVLLLKKDYLSKYRTYLESLSDKDLYEHYNKNV